jgi:hypothetical protein
MIQRWSGVAAALLTSLSALVQAQDWPTKPNMERPFDER